MERRISEHILAVVGVEPAIVLLLVAIGSWVFYRFFLKDLSADRHRLYRSLFYDLLTYGIGFLFTFSTHECLEFFGGDLAIVGRVLPYSGFVNIFLAAIIAVKILRIAAYNFLFFNSRKAGVPRLLVNIFSLLLSLFFLGLILTEVFEVKIVSVMATSAVLSVVLGLAMQDTLGNLFAAISLQIDKPFSLGDWIELRNGAEKISGMVAEVSWRATILIAFTDESVTIPNRMLAQWQILNFSARERPFFRGHIFRIPFGENLERVREALFASVEGDPGVLKSPPPLTLVLETTESWVSIKLVYAINQYGQQYVIGDRVQAKVLKLFAEKGIRLASSRMVIEGAARPEATP